MKVLYIDDDRINTLLFVETCRFARGVDVEAAGTGAEALELALQIMGQIAAAQFEFPGVEGDYIIHVHYLEESAGTTTLAALPAHEP